MLRMVARKPGPLLTAAGFRGAVVAVATARWRARCSSSLMLSSIVLRLSPILEDALVPLTSAPAAETAVSGGVAAEVAALVADTVPIPAAVVAACDAAAAAARSASTWFMVPLA